MHRRARRHRLRRRRRAHQLVHDPLRTPPRMRPPQLTHPRLQLRRGLTRARPRPPRTIRQPRQPRLAIPRHPRMHRLARHTDLGRDLAHRGAVQHRHHRPVPLLDNRQRHQRQSRPPAQSAKADHGQRRQPCPETRLSSMCRDRTPADDRCRVRIFSTTSRRPSAAAGCARLASLAVLAGQHQERELARESLTGDSRAPANVNTGHRGRRGREARHPQLFAVAAATPA